MYKYVLPSFYTRRDRKKKIREEIFHKPSNTLQLLLHFLLFPQRKAFLCLDHWEGEDGLVLHFKRQVVGRKRKNLGDEEGEGGRRRETMSAGASDKNILQDGARHRTAATASTLAFLSLICERWRENRNTPLRKTCLSASINRNNRNPYSHLTQISNMTR